MKRKGSDERDSEGERERVGHIQINVALLLPIKKK